jgi:hypothetical protein
MNQPEQNMAVEVLASFSLIGSKPLDYRTTPISETEMARASCPFRNDLSRDGWWQRGLDPRDDDGKEVLALLDRAKARYARDNAARKNRVAADEGLLPEENETLYAWLARLATVVSANGAGQSFFQVLKAFVNKFPEKAGKDLTETERRTLSLLTKKFREVAA